MLFLVDTGNLMISFTGPALLCLTSTTSTVILVNACYYCSIKVLLIDRGNIVLLEPDHIEVIAGIRLL